MKLKHPERADEYATETRREKRISKKLDAFFQSGLPIHVVTSLSEPNIAEPQPDPQPEPQSEPQPDPQPEPQSEPQPEPQPEPHDYEPVPVQDVQDQPMFQPMSDQPHPFFESMEPVEPIAYSYGPYSLHDQLMMYQAQNQLLTEQLNRVFDYFLQRRQ
jgi:outer membrane biosynthesis protein TonB